MTGRLVKRRAIIEILRPDTYKVASSVRRFLPGERLSGCIIATTCGHVFGFDADVGTHVVCMSGPIRSTVVGDSDGGLRTERVTYWQEVSPLELLASAVDE